MSPRRIICKNLNSYLTPQKQGTLPASYTPLFVKRKYPELGERATSSTSDGQCKNFDTDTSHITNIIVLIIIGHFIAMLSNITELSVLLILLLIRLNPERSRERFAKGLLQAAQRESTQKYSGVWLLGWRDKGLGAVMVRR